MFATKQKGVSVRSRLSDKKKSVYVVSRRYLFSRRECKSHVAQDHNRSAREGKNEGESAGGQEGKKKGGKEGG